MSKPSPLIRLLPVVAALLLAGLACNLEVGAEPTPITTPVSMVERPMVEITDPAEGATFQKGQTVSVHARATSISGVTLVELLVNGIRVASQPPAEGATPVSLDVVLDYIPEQTGTVALAVRAYSGAVVGQPATRAITVLPESGAGQGGQTGQVTYLPPGTTVYNPLCRARTNTNLNFRAGPGIEYSIVTSFRAGDEPQIVGYADRPDGRWWQVIWGGQYGWIKASYTTQLGDCSAIRPGTVPPSPTPVPSATPLPTQPGATAAPALPDLRLTRFDGPQQVQLGADSRASATYIMQVQNSGGQASGQFRIGVVLPDGTGANFDVPGLNPGQAFQVPSNGLNVTFTSPGLKRILVTVDDANQVAESNEGNNQAYLDITVNPGPATYTPPPASTNTPFPTSTPLPTAAPLPTEPPGDGNPQASLVASFDLHGGRVTALAFSPDGLTLVSSSRDGTVRLWDIMGQQEMLTLSGHTDRVMGVAYGPSGADVASASWDGTVRLWSVSTGETLKVFDLGGEANYVAFSPDGSRIAAGGANPGSEGGLDGLVKVWDVNAGTAISAIQTYGPVTGVGFLNASALVVASAGKSCDLGGGAVEVYDAGSGALSQTFQGSSEWITSLIVDSGNGRVFASGQQGLCSGEPVVWAWAGSGGLLTTLTGANSAITALDYDAYGRQVVASGENGRVWVWDIAQSSLMQTIDAERSATAVATTPDGTYIASGGDDGSIHIWKLG